MLEKYFKPASEKFAIPFIKICIALRIKPNALSLLGLIIVIGGCYLFMNDVKTLGSIVIFLGSAVDGLDGPLARSNNMITKKGALLDSFIDRISELFIWSVVAIKFTTTDFELFIVLSVITFSNLIPYLRARGESLGIDNKVGIAARPERVILQYFICYLIYRFIIFTYLQFYYLLLFIKDLTFYIKIYNENFTIYDYKFKSSNIKNTTLLAY